MPEGDHKAAMRKPGRRGVARLVDATRYSMHGFRAAWRHEEGFRQESMLLLIMTPLAVWLAEDITQFLLLILSCALVLLAEMLNSALESVVDRIGTENHPLSGQAKDRGSAAVFVTLMLVLVVWGGVAWQRFGPSL